MLLHTQMALFVILYNPCRLCKKTLEKNVSCFYTIKFKDFVSHPVLVVKKIFILEECFQCLRVIKYRNYCSSLVYHKMGNGCKMSMEFYNNCCPVSSYQPLSFMTKKHSGQSIISEQFFIFLFLQELYFRVSIL